VTTAFRVVLYDIDTVFAEFENKSISNGAVDGLDVMAFNTIGLDGPSPGTIAIVRDLVPGPYGGVVWGVATCDATNVNEPTPSMFNVYNVNAPVPVVVIVAHGLVPPARLEAPVSSYLIGTLVLVEIAAGACAVFNATVLPPIGYVIELFTTAVLNVMAGAVSTFNVAVIVLNENLPDAAWVNVIVAVPGLETFTR
jgi:hypothetical protein